MNNKCVIDKIKMFPGKGQPGQDLAKARLIAHYGLEGDYHATGTPDDKEKQLTILSSETRDEITRCINTGKDTGLCFTRFAENITIRGLDLDMLTTGVCLLAGEAVLEITGEEKRCHKCPLYESGKQCPIAGKHLFAKVTKSGDIQTGDEIRVSNS